jgi:hypothetical protein
MPYIDGVDVVDDGDAGRIFTEPIILARLQCRVFSTFENYKIKKNLYGFVKSLPAVSIV